MKPPLRSSFGAPGAYMTPSSERNLVMIGGLRFDTAAIEAGLARRVKMGRTVRRHMCASTLGTITGSARSSGRGNQRSIRVAAATRRLGRNEPGPVRTIPIIVEADEDPPTSDVEEILQQDVGRAAIPFTDLTFSQIPPRPVPEPNTFILFGLGIFAAGRHFRRCPAY